MTPASRVGTVAVVEALQLCDVPGREDFVVDVGHACVLWGHQRFCVVNGEARPGTFYVMQGLSQFPVAFFAYCSFWRHLANLIKGSIDYDLPQTKAVVHDGVVVVAHLAGVSKVATPAVTVVCTIRVTVVVTPCNCRWDLAIWEDPGILPVIMRL